MLQYIYEKLADMEKVMKVKKGKAVLKYMYQYKWLYIPGVLALIIVDLCQLQIPQITGHITDELQAASITTEGLLKMVLTLLVYGLVIAIGRFAWRYFIFGTSRKIERSLRRDYYEKLQSLSVSFFNENKTGDLMAYATNDLNAIRMMTGPAVLMILDALFLTLFVLVRMITTISLRLTLVSIIPLPIIAVGSLLLGKVIRRRFKEKQEAFAHMSDMVQENISGMRVIKAFVKEAYEMERFAIANQNNYDKNMKVVKLFAFMMPLVMVVSGLSIAIALGYGGRMTMIGQITLGEFVTFVQYLMMLIWPMMAFGWSVNILSQGMASLSRYEEVMSTPVEVHDSEHLESVDHVKGGIEFKGLTFAYESDVEPIIKGLDVKIEPGTTIGILGRTGSGKTTLANVLLRLFNPPEGTVFIDGIDILSMPLKTLRQSFGYVPQDNFLFSDTLANNIGFAAEEVDIEDVKAYAAQADVHDNIVEFKDGYDTIVGERGVTLSGGQKQRVSIARALMTQAPILILDDAVSAVDTKTEESILSMLKEKRAGMTTIMIAHRISTLQNADRILVIDEGRLVEEGTHEALIEMQGYYYEMVKQQQLEKEITEEG